MNLISTLSLATKISGLACPRCTSTAFHKSGRHLGIQRYCCTSCGRTFNETVNTPLHGIHDKQKMLDYLITMHDQQSIRAASKQIGISVPTSFSWRHRILASLKEQSPAAGTSPAAICEIKLPHSFKGKHNVKATPMPITHSLVISDARGISNLQLLTTKKKPLEAALLITNSLKPATQTEHIKTNLLSRAVHKISRKTVPNKSESKSLAKLAKNTTEKLSCWMARFNGVATKYLQQYWNWFRAESNFQSLELFRTECFGQRQLHHYHHIVAE